MLTEIVTPLHIIFYVFASLALLSALAVITLRNPVHSVLALVLTFFSMAGVWMILRAEFLSLILILVYVGAVMTLFLFVLMMLNIHVEDNKAGFVRYLPFGVILVLVMVGIMLLALSPTYFGLTTMPAPLPQSADYNNTQQLGTILYTTYVYPFEIAGVLLLAAIIAAITLTHRKPRRKVQYPEKQVNVKPEDRIRLIKMVAEKKESQL